MRAWRAGRPAAPYQTWLWLPLEEHPASFWPELDAITPWPFEDHDIFTMVYTTGRIMDGMAPIRGVVRDEDGDWQFLDGDDVTQEDIRVIHLHHLYAKHPHIGAAARLTAGRQLWRDGDGWQESAL